MGEVPLAPHGPTTNNSVESLLVIICSHPGIPLSPRVDMGFTQSVRIASKGGSQAENVGWDAQTGMPG